MATIPIEVIVQDENSPTPTPTPDPGENTNITVPDTGTGTVDSNNNSFTNSSAAISIVSIVIAVLAIGTIVALLIRRYNKRKKANIEAGNNTRQERKAVVVTSTVAVLALTVLLGQLVVAGVVSPITTNAATDDTASDEAELDVDSKITIIATRTEDESTTVATVKNTSTITVDKPFGYELAISMVSDNTNLYLDGDETSEYYLSPVEESTLVDNTWGYTLDKEEYKAVPPVDDLAAIAKGTTPVTDEDIDIYYGIKVDKDLPAGTYTGELEYILADTGFPAALRTMQDITTDICSSVPTPEPFKADGTTIEDNVPSIMLKDTRDNKLYRVAKLADSKCWMTQNLDLQKEDLLAGVVLNDSNTDHPKTGFALSASQTSGDMDWSGDETAYDTVHVYDPSYNETKYYYCVNYSFGPGCLEYSDEEVPLKSFSNYYNWYTATAGTGTYNLGQGEVAEGSICPAGWRLPSGGVNQAATDFSNLFYRYGILSSPTSASEAANISALYEQPLLFLRGSGAYYHGLSGVGVSSNIWTSMAYGESYGSNSAWSLGITTTISANPWLYNGKYGGMSVRCVAR